MSLVRYDMTGASEVIPDLVLNMPERVVIELYPYIHHIVDTVTDETVWTRTMAYFPGDYDPGSKVLKP